MPVDLDDPPGDRVAEARRFAAVRAGNRAAAERWVEATYGAVFAALVRLAGGDRELAADLTQETYRKAWQSLGEFRGDAASATWLFRIAYTTFLNQVRRPQRLVALDGGAGLEIRDPAPSSDELLAGGQVRGRLRRAVLALADPLRFTLTAHYWGELPVKEIARLEGISPVAVRKRLSKALSALDVLLQETDR